MRFCSENVNILALIVYVVFKYFKSKLNRCDMLLYLNNHNEHENEQQIVL